MISITHRLRRNTTVLSDQTRSPQFTRKSVDLSFLSLSLSFSFDLKNKQTCFTVRIIISVGVSKVLGYSPCYIVFCFSFFTIFCPRLFPLIFSFLFLSFVILCSRRSGKVSSNTVNNCTQLRKFSSVWFIYFGRASYLLLVCGGLQPTWDKVWNSEGQHASASSHLVERCLIAWQLGRRVGNGDLR